jgi:ADP-heptose:LPS heptosyltransferase
LDLKIIVIRACAIGDFVLNLPALEAVQKSQPDSRFTLIGYPGTLDLAREFVNVAAVGSIELEPWRQLFHGPIAGLDFDRAIVWMKDASVAESLRRSGLKSVLHADPFPKTGHAATHLVETLGLPVPELPDHWEPGSHRIILHPGSGGRWKCWPHFSELADQLPYVAFLIGPAEADFDTRTHVRLENLSLREVAKLLANCRGFVGNDSGITHLAAHLGVPTVAIFGPTDPRVWGPFGRRVSIIKNPDLRAVRVEDVIQKLP